MFIAVLQFELLIAGAGSLKDKRRVVRSVKDTLHRRHLVAVAEVRHLDNMRVAGMALAAVSRDVRYLRGLLDTIEHRLRGLHDAQLGDCYREILPGDQLPTAYADETGAPLWTPDEAREPPQTPPLTPAPPPPPPPPPPGPASPGPAPAANAAPQPDT